MLALVTASDARDPDIAPTKQALDDLGCPSEIAVWDDATVDWGRFDTVVIRSTWDYTGRLDQFLGWCASVSATTKLWNPPEVISWNTDKHYLRDLADRGLPVVRSTFGGLAEHDLSGDIVVKPSVAAGSEGAARFTSDPLAAATHVEALLARGRVPIVQPYQAAIDSVGETALVYFGGRLSHCFGKAAILTETGTIERDPHEVNQVARREPSEAELDVADRLLATLPPLAYARIDLIPTDDGPAILEVELVEPSPFFETCEDGPRHAAEAFAALT